MSKKTLLENQEFQLTDYQKGVIKTLNDMAVYMTQLHVQPMQKALSTNLTQYAQEHFEYPEGTQLQFDIDPTNPDMVKVIEVPDASGTTT